MLTYNKITAVKFDKEIPFPKEIKRATGNIEETRFTDIEDVNPIPSHSIIYKTITGIGATHSEIVAKRSSIIVLPHISIVISKHDSYKEKYDTFPVYGEIKPFEIKNYLTSDSEYAKILTTPKGLDKIIKAMAEFGNLADYKKLFFLLIDECHKIIQDAQYRSDMLDIMDHFFEFERKAMVSATPIPPSDPRFKKQEFKHIKVYPDYDYKKDLDLIHADSLVNGLKLYFKNNYSDCYCIFFNSIEGIRSIIKQLQIIDDYKIYCSQESFNLLKLDGESNAAWKLDGLMKYNFFTSSFFNGLDIEENKPDIIILTDYGYREHTLLDPFTDILQIIGRFRKKKDGSNGYNKITHINNTRKFTNPISEEVALQKVEQSKFVFEHIHTLKESIANKDLEPLFDQALTTVKPYSKLLTKDGQLSYFLLDNYLDDERVKNYYKSASALRTAYSLTKLYNVTNKRECYDVDELINLQRNSLRSSKDMNCLMAQALLNLEDYQGLDIYFEQRDKVAKHSFTIFDAYERLGYTEIAALGFSNSKIKKALLKLDIEEGKNTYPVIEMVYSTFGLNKYYSVEIVKAKLQKMYDDFKLPVTATATDVERYFEFKSGAKTIDGKRVRFYLFKSKKLYPVVQQKHV